MDMDSIEKGGIELNKRKEELNALYRDFMQTESDHTDMLIEFNRCLAEENAKLKAELESSLEVIKVLNSTKETECVLHIEGEEYKFKTETPDALRFALNIIITKAGKYDKFASIIHTAE